jgi:hypothetical protein
MTDMPYELCFDAIAANAARIPRRAFAVAGYVNGANTSFIWKPAQWNLFPGAAKFGINVTGDPRVGDFLDVERSDARPAHVAPWIDSRRQALPGGYPLVVYCNRSNLAAVLAARGRRKAFICVATLDGTMAWDGRAMVQFSNAKLSGGPYDVSVMWHQDLIRAAAEFLT